jgi:hypothetical protein
MSSAADPPLQLNRREAVRRVSLLLGGAAFVGGRRLLAACEAAGAGLPQALPGEFTAGDIALLDEIAETILPATSTPGARAAKTGAFMALMVTDCYRPREQAVFRDGLRAVDAAMRGAHQVSFIEATAAQRTLLLTALDQEQKRSMDARDETNRTESQGAGAAEGPPAHYFRMMKELALLGFFTSEIGCTQVRRYVEAPGRFDGCVPYAPGDPAWADHA